MVKVRNHNFVLILLVFFIYYLGCKNSPNAPDQTPKSLQITAESFVIFSGGKLQMFAIATLRDGSTKDVTTEAI